MDGYHPSFVLSKDPVDRNLVTFLMQVFDSLLPLGTQYTLRFLKEKKTQGFLVFFAALPLCSAWAEGSAFTGAVAGGWLTPEQRMIFWQCRPTGMQGFEHLGDFPPFCSAVIPLRPWPQKVIGSFPPAAGNLRDSCSPQLCHHTRHEFILGGVVTKLARLSCSKGAHQPILEDKEKNNRITALLTRFKRSPSRVRVSKTQYVIWDLIQNIPDSNTGRVHFTSSLILHCLMSQSFNSWGKWFTSWE